MMIVRLPATLSGSGRPDAVPMAVPAAATVGGVLDELDQRLPGLVGKLLDGEGRLYGYVNIYVNGDDIRRGAGIQTAVKEGDEILVLPAISGG